MSLRLSLLSAAAVAALFAHNAAEADGYRYSACSAELFSGRHCASDTDNRSRTPNGLRDRDHDNGSDRQKDKDKGKDSGKDKEGPGGNGGNGGGGEGGEGGND